MVKIYKEIVIKNKERTRELQQDTVVKWTKVEVAQLLVAVLNLGEGEWMEVQKRINFTSSGQIKTPNQVALKWRSIKRRMARDLK